MLLNLQEADLVEKSPALCLVPLPLRPPPPPPPFPHVFLTI